jgi:hypothetical protein
MPDGDRVRATVIGRRTPMAWTRRRSCGSSSATFIDQPYRHQRIIIDLSLYILRAAAAARSGKVDTIEVRLALRCLLAHCPERWPLDMFWNSAGTDHDIGRAQGCTAALNGIMRQLELNAAA